MSEKTNLDHYVCNPEHPEGTPLCGLGYECSTPQLKGASGLECCGKKREVTEWWSHECDIMFIGEAPGWEEDRRKLPFVGKTGDLLFEYFLTSAGFDLNRTYFTNAVKCKPPRGRKPNKPALEEIQACKRHIEWEIRHFQPKVVVLLGNIALRTFNLHSEGGIKNIHGKLFEKKFPGWDDGPTFKVIPTYHPAYFLHTESNRLQKRVIRDYIFAKNLVDGFGTDNNFYTPEYKVCNTMEDVGDLVKVLSSKPVFAFDTESKAFPWTTCPMICFSFSVGKDQNYVLPFHNHDPEGDEAFKMRPAWTDDEKDEVLNLLSVPFEDESIAKIAHNMKYDYKVVRRWCGFEIKGMWWDTMLLHHLLEDQGPHDLEFLADIEFHVGDYSAPKREITGHGDHLRNTYDKVPDEILHPYAATDAECVYRLFEVYHEQLKEKPNLEKLYYEETLPIQHTLAESEWYGNKIDRDVINVLLKEQEEKKAGIERKLLSHTQDPTFKPGSPKQVVTAMQKLGFGSLIANDNKVSGYSVDKDTLGKASEKGCEFAQHILDYRSTVKLISTYLKKALNEVDSDGRIRYSWLIHGTESGRLSCRFLHQVPRIDERRIAEGKKNLRDILVAEDGYKFVYMDYSQIEMRILGLVAPDPVLLDLLDRGEDLHAVAAAAALGIGVDEVSDFNRQVGKKLDFGVSFGSKGHSLLKEEYDDPEDGKRKRITDSKVDEFIAAYHAKFPGIAAYIHDAPLDALSKNGLVTTVFGRERKISGLNSPDMGARQHAEREAINVRIQGPAGAITIRTSNEVRAMRDSKGLGPEDLRQVNTVHDSIIYEVKDEYVEWFTQALKAIAERPIPELENYCFPIDMGVGRSWGDAEMNAKEK